MRTILAILFMALATQVSAWSENVTRTEANSLEDLITLSNGISFHIPEYLEYDDGFLDKVSREASEEQVGNPSEDPMYFNANLMLNLINVFRIKMISPREAYKTVSQTNIAEASEDELSKFYENQKQSQKQFYELVGYELLDFIGRKELLNDRYYLTTSSLYKVNNKNFSDLPYRLQIVNLFYLDLDNSLIASFQGLSDLQGEVQRAAMSFVNTLEIP